MLTCALILVAASAAAPAWQSLAPGIEYAAVRWQTKPAHGDGKLHVVRIDPVQAQLVAAAASAGDKKNRTAAHWREQLGLVAVINAGMYDTDFSGHVGFFRNGKHVNSGVWVAKYKSALVFAPREAKLARALVIDLDSTTNFPFERYGVVVQNLRLIKAPAKNVWARNRRSWSETALAIDSEGRLLFLFSRTPATMHDFNNMLIRDSGLRIVQAMHMEGGPEASLSVKGAGIALDLCGSYETGFNENDDNQAQWPLPNILGVGVRPEQP